MAQQNDPQNPFGNQLIISVKEARKLLGHKAKNLTNEELEALILNTETVVRVSVREFIRSNTNENGAILDVNNL